MAAGMEINDDMVHANAVLDMHVPQLQDAIGVADNIANAARRHMEQRRRTRRREREESDDGDSTDGGGARGGGGPSVQQRHRRAHNGAGSEYSSIAFDDSEYFTDEFSHHDDSTDDDDDDEALLRRSNAYCATLTRKVTSCACGISILETVSAMGLGSLLMTTATVSSTAQLQQASTKEEKQSYHGFPLRQHQEICRLFYAENSFLCVSLTS